MPDNETRPPLPRGYFTTTSSVAYEQIQRLYTTDPVSPLIDPTVPTPEQVLQPPAPTMHDDKRLVMYIREMMLEYFKGACHSVTELDYGDASRLSVQQTSLPRSNRRSYQFERQEHESKGEREMYVDGAVLMRYSHKPDTVTIYKRDTNRWMSKELERFFITYLAGVKLVIVKED